MGIIPIPSILAIWGGFNNCWDCVCVDGGLPLNPPSIKQVFGIIILIGLFAAIFLPSLSSLTSVGFSTETEIVQKDSDFVHVKAELTILDENDHSYATGWNSEDGSVKSEQIVWSAKWWFYADGDAWCGEGCRGKYDTSNAMEYRYIVKINNVEVASFPSTGYYGLTGLIVPNTGQWYDFNLETGSYYAHGSQFGEIQIYLECAFELFHDDIFNIRKIDYSQDFGKMSKDGAYLKSGESTLRLGGALPDLIEEGSNVEFYMKTGFTHGTGHTVFITSPSGEKIEYTGDGFSGQDGFEGTVKFKIPIGWFVLNDDNEVKIELFNRLWSESKTTFFVIDKVELAPTITSITWNTDYKSGSTVTVNVLAEPNPTTQSPISYFRIYVYFGVPGSMPGFADEYIINGVDYPAVSGAVQFSFNIPDNRGDSLSVKASAIAEDGRASLGEWKSMNVINTNDPDDDGGDEGGDVHYPFMWNLEAIIIASIMAIALCGIWLIGYQLQIDWKILIILTLIIVVPGVLCVWLAGSLIFASWGISLVAARFTGWI